MGFRVALLLLHVLICPISGTASAPVALPEPAIDESATMSSANAFWLAKNCSYSLEDPQAHSYFWSIRRVENVRVSIESMNSTVTNFTRNEVIVGYLFGTPRVSANLVWDSILPEIKSKMYEADKLVFELDQHRSKQSFIDCFARLIKTDPALPDAIAQRTWNFLPEGLKHWNWGALFNLFDRDSMPPQWLFQALLMAQGNQEKFKLDGEEDNLDQWMLKEAMAKNKPIGFLERIKDQQFCEILPSLRDRPELMNFALEYMLNELEAMQTANLSLHMGYLEYGLERYKCGLYGVEDDLLGDGKHQFAGGMNQSQLEMLQQVNGLIQADQITRRNLRIAPIIDRMLRAEPDKKLFFTIGAGHLDGNASLVQLLAERGYVLREHFLPPQQGAFTLENDWEEGEEKRQRKKHDNDKAVALKRKHEADVIATSPMMQQASVKLAESEGFWRWTPTIRYLLIGFGVIGLLLVGLILGMLLCRAKCPHQHTLMCRRCCQCRTDSPGNVTVTSAHTLPDEKSETTGSPPSLFADNRALINNSNQAPKQNEQQQQQAFKRQQFYHQNQQTTTTTASKMVVQTRNVASSNTAASHISFMDRPLPSTPPENGSSNKQPAPKFPGSLHIQQPSQSKGQQRQENIYSSFQANKANQKQDEPLQKTEEKLTTLAQVHNIAVNNNNNSTESMAKGHVNLGAIPEELASPSEEKGKLAATHVENVVANHVDKPMDTHKEAPKLATPEEENGLATGEEEEEEAVTV